MRHYQTQRSDERIQAERKVPGSVKSHSEYFKVLRAARLTNRSSQRPRWSWRRQQRRGMEDGRGWRGRGGAGTSAGNPPDKWGVCQGPRTSRQHQQLRGFHQLILLSLNKEVTHVLPIDVEKLRKLIITDYASTFFWSNKLLLKDGRKVTPYFLLGTERKTPLFKEVEGRNISLVL